MSWKEILKAGTPWQRHNQDAIRSFNSGLTNKSFQDIGGGFDSASAAVSQMNKGTKGLGNEYWPIIEQLEQILPRRKVEDDGRTLINYNWTQIEQQAKPLIDQLDQFGADNPLPASHGEGSWK
jgi:hypothetical protein